MQEGPQVTRWSNPCKSALTLNVTSLDVKELLQEAERYWLDKGARVSMHSLIHGEGLFSGQVESPNNILTTRCHCDLQRYLPVLL